MNKFQYLLIFIFISVTGFSQGIAVQGIARDNTSSAIGDEILTFTFDIIDNSTVLYSESQSIKTDNFGVFSHIVSTGASVDSFTEVDFSIKNLSIKVSVAYNGNTIEVYNQEFQYVPYAKYAENGVPAGSVMPYLGTTAPEGWMLCDGSSIPAQYTALIAIVGNNTPNLKGTFLRGTGISVTNNQSGPNLREYQQDDFEGHTHNSGTYKTDEQGDHNHANGSKKQLSQYSDGYNAAVLQGQVAGRVDAAFGADMLNAGDHVHDVQGYSGSTGGTETRPVNYGVNYIIKL